MTTKPDKALQLTVIPMRFIYVKDNIIKRPGKKILPILRSWHPELTVIVLDNRLQMD
jgi:hypothetical protein